MSTYSVSIPAIIGAIKYKKTIVSFRPVIFFMWVGLLNEIISEITSDILRNDTVNNNIYTLFDYSLIIVIFMYWDDTGRKTKYIALLVAGFIAWFTDNLILHSLTTISSYFRIIYGLVVVFLSVAKLNEVLFSEVRHLLKNAMFIICVTMVMAYSYQAVFEVFGVINLKFSNRFYIGLYLILIYINLIGNLLYGYAMLWLPTKRQFTRPY